MSFPQPPCGLDEAGLGRMSRPVHAAFAIWVWLDKRVVYVAGGSTAGDIRYSPHFEAAHCFPSADAVLRFVASLPQLLAKIQHREAGIVDLDCRFVGAVTR